MTDTSHGLHMPESQNDSDNAEVVNVTAYHDFSPYALCWHHVDFLKPTVLKPYCFIKADMVLCHA